MYLYRYVFMYIYSVQAVRVFNNPSHSLLAIRECFVVVVVVLAPLGGKVIKQFH